MAEAAAPTPASNGASDSQKGDGKKGPFTDENLAKAAGVVVVGGIAWSLLRKMGNSEPAAETEITEEVPAVVEETKEAAAAAVADVSAAVTSAAEPAKKKGWGLFAGEAEKVTSLPKLGGPKDHVVSKGETLFSLSRKYNVSVSALQTANSLKGDKIEAGQKLSVPSS